MHRIRRSLIRSVDLLLWGYMLNLNIFRLFGGGYNWGFYSVNVLHCIGVGLIVISLLFLLVRALPSFVFAFFLLLVGLALFTFEPWVANYDWQIQNRFLLSWVSKETGSVFTPLPWVGYTCLGGFFGVLYAKLYTHDRGRYLLLVLLFAIGVLLSSYSSKFFMDLFRAYDLSLFKDIAYNNYLYIRLGHALIIIGLFFIFEKLLSRLQTFNRIGQSTLNIYIVHYFILYGSVFGLGLVNYYRKALSPEFAIPGAIIFMIVCTLDCIKIEDSLVA